MCVSANECEWGRRVVSVSASEFLGKNILFVVSASEWHPGIALIVSVPASGAEVFCKNSFGCFFII